MAHVVIPFRKRRSKAQDEPAAPRHRRDGWFDEQDVWHAAEHTEPAVKSASS
jgi:hypothetical protein